MTTPPQYIELETARLCNRRCHWCPNGASDARSEQELMDWDLFIKIIEELREREYAGWLALHNYNEPLLNPRLLTEIQEIRSRLPSVSVSIFTNGDHLRRSTLHELAESGANHVRVTLYPGRGSLVTLGRSDETRLNRWLSAKELRADIQWTMVPVRQGLAAKAQIQSLSVDVIDPDLTTYNYRGGTARTIEWRPRQEPCYMTSHSAAIDFSGRMKMCCNIYPHDESHTPYLVGDLRVESFWRLWEGQQMAAFRARHRRSDWELSPICRLCSHQLPPDQVQRYEASHLADP
jgi:MoaA/NifB/PqqE/SkfB family radical SAM enzyme